MHRSCDLPRLSRGMPVLLLLALAPLPLGAARYAMVDKFSQLPYNGWRGRYVLDTEGGISSAG